MKLNKMKLANTLALSMAILWILCGAFLWLFPAFMDLSAMANWHLTFSNFFLGGVMAIISAWITGWVIGWSWQVVGGNSRR